jgi:hypothetical protein
MISVFSAFAALTLFRWLVRTRTLTALVAAISLAAVVAAFRVATGAPLTAAMIAGVIAGAAGWSLAWLDDRFHSFATIPIWFVSSAVAIVVLMAVM